MKILLAWGLATIPAIALEAPQKVEPLAPSQPPAPLIEEAVVPPAEPDQDKAQATAEMPQVGKQKAYLGVGLDPLPAALAQHMGLDVADGAFVRIVDPKGPAALAGIGNSDIILSVDGIGIHDQDSFCQLIREHQPGDELKLSVMHRGEKREVAVKLGARPDNEIAGAVDAAPAAGMLQEEVLRQLPKEMRDAIEQNLKAMGAVDILPDAKAQIMPLDGEAHHLKKRLEKMVQGMQLQLGQGGAGVQMRSTLKMMDNEGNIEINRDDDSCEAKVFDKNGELLWSGPYQTQQDKIAVPPPIRERLEALNLDTTGNGIQLRMMPRQ